MANHSRPLVLLALTLSTSLLAGCSADRPSSNTEPNPGEPLLSQVQAQKLLAQTQNGSIDGVKYTLGSEDSGFNGSAPGFIQKTFPDGLPATDPENCGNSAGFLVLYKQDRNKTNSSLRVGRTLQFSDDTSLDPYVRYFRSISEARSFFSAYRSELSECSEFRVATSTTNVKVDQVIADGPAADSFTQDISIQPGDATKTRVLYYRVGNILMAIIAHGSNSSEQTAEQHAQALADRNVRYAKKFAN